MSEMRANSRRRQRQSGVAMILLTLMLMSVLLPMVALAIDVTMLYVVKAKLQGAVDGAVLAAGRSITGAVTLAAQTTRLQNIAQQFLKANLPQGYWGATAPVIEGSECTTGAGCVNVTQNQDTKKIFITVTASVQVPLLFARTIWNKETNSFNTTSTVRVTGQALRRWVRLVLVLDRSSSMSGDPISKLKDAVTNSDPQKGFVVNFDESRDQLGMVVFGGSAIVAYPPRDPTIADGGGSGPDGHFKTGSPNIIGEVNNLAAGSNTGTAEGLILAYKELTKNPQPLYLNAIVLFTDGMPNGITAGWNGNSAPSKLYYGSSVTPIPGPDDVPTAFTSSAILSTSTCKYKNYSDSASNQLVGWMAQWGGYANSTPYGHGLYVLMQKKRYPGTSDNTTDVQTWLANPDESSTSSGTKMFPDNSDNCYFRNSGTSQFFTTSDVGSFPTADLYGNALLTDDYKASYEYHKVGVTLSSTQVTNAYQIGLAAWNAAYQSGKRIRGDKNLKPVIYCIGYSGGDTIDRALMKRLANTNQDFTTWSQDAQGQYLTTDYDPTSTTGRYYDAASTGAIAAAFQQVQSEILRLSM